MPCAILPSYAGPLECLLISYVPFLHTKKRYNFLCTTKRYIRTKMVRTVSLYEETVQTTIYTQHIIQNTSYTKFGNQQTFQRTAYYAA